MIVKLIEKCWSEPVHTGKIGKATDLGHRGSMVKIYKKKSSSLKSLVLPIRWIQQEAVVNGKFSDNDR